ncbi:MAG TPA: efflux transporter outer membrane subunit [Candidatus Polarisedimenticolia bacterium]|jgi:NodT family efflux transporter outer membrane factor (OMF) lipoprotein|nr:efflux transporter outer membrane subunit [Candidatus Polarisedimenticolia bacterium]
MSRVALTRPRAHRAHSVPAGLGAAVLLLSGCAAGPRYHALETVAPQAYKEIAAEGSDAAAALRPAQPSDAMVRGAWWEVFDDPDLNALEEQVDVQNQTIAQAEARFRGARAEVRLARAGLYPSLGVGASAVRSNGAASTAAAAAAGTSAGTVTLYQLPVDFSWEVDVFGRLRRTLEANTALAQASAADLEAIRLATHAELAVDYFTVRGLDAERDLLDSTVTDYEKTLQLTINRHDQGVVSGVDVAQAKTQLETTRADATDLRVTRAQVEHAIAVLLGRPPSEFSMASGKMPEAPPDVPPGLPSDLLERRPDIAAGERRIAAANAEIGIAKAAYFPTFTLAASGGYRATSLSSFFSLPNRFWSLGVEALETIFSSGRRRAVVEGAMAAYDENVAAYRQSVLGAFLEVEDNLAALRLLEEEARQQADAVAAARELVSLARNRYTGGVTSYLEVATAQTAALANERAATQLLVRRMVASVNLVKAVGGGWDVSDLPDRSTILKRTEAPAGGAAPAAGPASAPSHGTADSGATPQ